MTVTHLDDLPPRPKFLNRRSFWLLSFLVVIILSLHQTGIFTTDIFNPGGLSLLRRFLMASLQPELSPDFLRLTLRATLTTLAYAVCGTFLSVVIGLVGGVLVSEVWWVTVWQRQQPIRLGIRGLLAFPRAIHEMIWGLFFVNIWGLDPLVAIAAIAIPYGAIVAKVFSEILDETPRQPLIVLINSGVAPLSAFLYSLMPQASLNLVSYIFYRFECSIRSAAILGIIGAGGLGYEIFLSLQSLRYEQLWTLFYALFLLNGTVDLSSAWLRNRLGCSNRLDLNLQPSVMRSSSASLRLQGVIFLCTCVLILFCFWYIQADYSKLWSPRTAQLFQNIVQDASPPDFAQLPLQQWLSLSAQTLAMSILAIALAGFFAILLSFPAAANFTLSSKTRLGWIAFGITRFCFLVSRAIPAPILALVALFVLFPGILPGAIALALHNFGILGRLMAEGIENLEMQPIDALKAQGSPTASLFLYGVLPITLPPFLAYILYRWEVCLRETVIVGLVGAGGLGRLLTEQLSSFDYAGVVVTLGCFIVLTFLVDAISGTMRRSLR